MLALTGITGFIGSYYKMYLDNISVPYSHLDLRKPIPKILSNEISSVLHLAGKAHDLKKIIESDVYFDVNTNLTKYVYEIFLKSNAQTFVYVSSVKAIADKVQGDTLFETDIPRPLTPYGKSKLAAEQYLLSHPIPEGKKLYILRPCMIHGPENKGNLNLLFKLIKWGIPWPLGAFENKRSFFSIDNFCFVIDEILKGNLAPGVYNLADSEPLSTNQVIAILGKGLNKKPIIINLSKNIINAVAKLGDLVGLPLTSERLQKLTENYVVSNQKLINALGKDLPVTAQEGMLKTAISFTKN